MADEIKMLDLETTAPTSEVVEPVKKNKSSLPLFPIVMALVVIIAGVITGYVLVPKSDGQNANVPASGISSGGGKEVGLTNIDESKYDNATGVIEAGGLNGEGTHKLIREGGPTKTACLTSSAVDLDQFVGKKVMLWGQTQNSTKVGWLIDVVKVKVVE